MMGYYAGVGVVLTRELARFPTRKNNSRECSRFAKKNLNPEFGNAYKQCCQQATSLGSYHHIFFPNGDMKHKIQGYLAQLGVQIGLKGQSRLAAQQQIRGIESGLSQLNAPVEGGIVASECDFNPAACEEPNYQLPSNAGPVFDTPETVQWNVGSDDDHGLGGGSGDTLPTGLGDDTFSDDSYEPAPLPSAGLVQGGAGTTAGNGSAATASAGGLLGADPSEANADVPQPDSSIKKDKTKYSETRSRLSAGGKGAFARGGGDKDSNPLADIWNQGKQSGPEGGTEIEGYLASSVDGRGPASEDELSIQTQGIFERISKRYGLLAREKKLLEYETAP